MPYVIRRQLLNGRPIGWYVEREEGTNDKPDLRCEVASAVNAIAIRNMLNSIHPDLMDHCIQQALSESEYVLRSAAQ